jgi:CBS domain-containing protein
MKVRDVMTKEAVFCRLDTPLSEAAEIMWKRGCGFLPVLGEAGNVIGVITDRDLSIAFGTRNRRPSELLAKDVMPGKLFTCTAQDSIHSALNTMRIERLRRLPVIDREGTLVGVLSIDDLVLKASENDRNKKISYKDVEDAYKAINGMQLRPPKKARAAA